MISDRLSTQEMIHEFSNFGFELNSDELMALSVVFLPVASLTHHYLPLHRVFPTPPVSSPSFTHLFFY